MVENLVGSMMARLRGPAVAMMAAALLVGGCASTDTGAAEVWDPMETPNRFVFSINRTVDMIALRPLAVLYRDWMPERGQKGVPDLRQGTVTEGQFKMNFKPGCRVGCRVAFRIKEAGLYLLRVETLNTDSDHEHFAAIDVQADKAP